MLRAKEPADARGSADAIPNLAREFNTSPEPVPRTNSSGGPPSTVTAGQTFAYQVMASEPVGDPLTYALIGAPICTAIDSSGRISWPTTAFDVGISDSHILGDFAASAGRRHGFLSGSGDTTLHRATRYSIIGKPSNETTYKYAVIGST